MHKITAQVTREYMIDWLGKKTAAKSIFYRFFPFLPFKSVSLLHASLHVLLLLVQFI